MPLTEKQRQGIKVAVLSLVSAFAEAWLEPVRTLLDLISSFM